MIFTTETKRHGESSRIDLPVHKLREHFVGIDGDEQAFAMGQHFTFLVEDFGGVGVIASAHMNFPRLHAQGLVQRHGFQIIDSDG